MTTATADTTETSASNVTVNVNLSAVPAGMATVDVDSSKATVDKTVEFGTLPVTKAHEEQQLIFGWAYVSKRADGTLVVDSDGEAIRVDDLEKAAYRHVMEHRAAGDSHTGPDRGVLVESMMFTREKQQALGIPEGLVPEAWFVGYHIPDPDDYAVAKTRGMLSIQARTRKEPADVAA